jgi:RHS repeat-associated protein
LIKRKGRTMQGWVDPKLGSTSVVTNASGGVVGTQGDYPFGETRYSTGALFTDKLFTGQQEIAGLGLYNYRARFYDPYITHFIQPDTIVPDLNDPATLNRYAYALNNPINYNDPSGHCVSGAVADTIFCVFVAAMTVGAIIDAAVNAVSQYQDTGHIDWGEVGTHAVEGAVIAGAPFMAVAAAPAVMTEAGNTLSWAGANTGKTGLFNAGQGLNNASSSMTAWLNSPTYLPDSAPVCRGGTCLADQFTKGSGVTQNSNGTLSGISVSSAPNKSLEEISAFDNHKQIGVTTTGAIRAAGGNIVSSPSGVPYNPYHAIVSGLTAEQLHGLFTPTILNPYLAQIH